MNCEKSKELAIALDAANAASEIIESYAASGFQQETKVVDDTEMGLVTKADLEAEKTIVEMIRKSFPDHSFLAEETYAQTQTAEHLWIIDPIDGTNNFAHGIPHYSVSIAHYQGGIAKCGVIANPATGEVFWTEQGRGAWLGNKQVYVRSDTSLNEAIVATGFYYDRGKMMQETLASIEKLFQNNIRGIRRFGSAALDLAYVGCGRYSAFFEYQLHPWDFAAGKLFVEEAGGRATTCRGDSIPLESTTMLASNGTLHDLTLDVIRLS